MNNINVIEQISDIHPKSDDVLLITHLGLGDQIICNTIVRCNCKKFARVFLPVRVRNISSVSFMFRDLQESITLISVPNDYPSKLGFGVNSELNFSAKFNSENIISITEFDHPSFNYGIFEIEFYRLSNLPFSQRWDSFFVKRDIENEVLPSENQVIIHEQHSRGFTIDRQRLKKLLPKTIDLSGIVDINCFSRDNIFDLCSILENAIQIHCFCSAIFHLVESLPNVRGELYLHHYLRPEVLPQRRKNWRILT